MKTRSPTFVASYFLYLPINLLQRPTKDNLEPRPPVVGQVTGEFPCLLQEHAHVPQLDELGLGQAS